MKKGQHTKSLVSVLMAGSLVLASWGQPVQSMGPISVARVVTPSEALALDSSLPPPMPKALTVPTQAIVPAASVGYLPGSWDVTPTGDFTYAVPLDVPPGRVNMQPELTLNYSGGGNGLYGVGWSVSGFSSIQRCGRILATEEEVDGVDYSERDRFCLDGRKLIAVGAVDNGTGEYGRADTQYRTEADTFELIISRGDELTKSGKGPTHFTVFHKNGEILTYTAVEAKRIKAPRNGIPEFLGTVRAFWQLTKREDRAGNAITYEYLKTQGSGGASADLFALFNYRPYRIHYTSHKSGVAAQRFVEFKYQDRDDDSLSWQSGVSYAQTKRVSAIQMWTPNPMAPASKVWEYTFTYDQSPATKRSRLTSVTKCNSAGGCTWTKFFNWHDAPPQPTFQAQSPKQAWLYGINGTTAENELPALQVMELNGDGASDVLYHAGDLFGSGLSPDYALVSSLHASGASPLATTHTLSRLEPIATANYGRVRLAESIPVDINGDGRDELLAAIDNTHDSKVPDAEGCKWRMMHWGNSGFVRDWDQPCAIVGKVKKPYGWLSKYARQPVMFADLDGDGLPELLAGHNVSGWVEVDDDRGAVYEYKPEWTVSFNHAQGVPGHFGPGIPSTFSAVSSASVTDVNGDGRAEVMAASGAHFTTLDGHNRNLGKYMNSALTPPGPAAGGARRFGDFNGDGLADLLLIPNDDSATSLDSALYWNTGNGFYRDIHTVAIPSDVHPDQTRNIKTKYEDRGIRVADVNNDGRADIVAFHNASYPKVTLLLSNGDGTFLRWDHFFDNGSSTRIDAKHWLNEAERPYTERVVGPDSDTHYLILALNLLFGVPPINGVLAIEEPRQVVKDYADDSQVPGLAAGWALAQLGDFNGDGALDMLRHVSEGPVADMNILKGHFELLLQTAHIGDRLKSIRDQHTPWHREEITYSTEWSYNPASKLNDNCMYPQSCPRTGFEVVKSVTSRAHLVNPTAAQVQNGGRTLYYDYAKPVLDRRGRGFLGFDLFRVWDPTRPMETVTIFDHRRQDLNQDPSGKYYPSAGIPKQIVTAVPILTAAVTDTKPTSATARITLTSHADPQLRRLNGDKTYAVFPTTSTIQEWEQSVSIAWSAGFPHVLQVTVPQQPRRMTALGRLYDSFGNLEYQSSQAKAADGTLGVYRGTWTKYENRVDDFWLLGLPKYTIVESSKAGGGALQQRRVDFQHNILGQLKTVEVEKLGEASLQSTTLLSYNTFGQLIQRTTTVPGETKVHTTHIEYRQEYCTDRNNPSTCAPDEQIFPSQTWLDYQIPAYRPSTWSVVHPAYGMPVATMDGNGVQTVMTYDGFGRPDTIKRDGEEKAQFFYYGREDTYQPQPHDQVTFNGLRTAVTFGEKRFMASVTDARGLTLSTMRTPFDGVGKLQTETTYDVLGRPKTVSNPYRTMSHGLTRYIYDSLDRRTETVYPNQTRVRYAFPTMFETHTYTPGNVTSNPATENHNYVLTDVDGRLTSAVNVLSSNDGTTAQPITTTYTYAPFDLVEDVYDNMGHKTHIEYDLLGRRVKTTGPDRGTTTTTYNGFGQMVSEAHHASNQFGPYIDELATYQYDELGRVTLVNTSDGPVPFTWDSHGIGRLAQTLSPFGIGTQHYYDSLGRPCRTDYTDYTVGLPYWTYSTEQSYDPETGRLATVAYPEVPGRPRFTIRYDYNNQGFLKQVVDATAGQALWTADVRDLDLGFTQDTLGNGVTVWQNREPLMGRLVHMAAAQGNNILLNFDYSHYPNGLVKSRTGSDDTGLTRIESFHYDSLQRLKQWDLQYKSPRSAQFTVVPSTGYAYDTLGNLTDVYKGTAATPLQPSELFEHNTYGHPDGSQPNVLTASSAHGTYAYDQKGRQTIGGGRSNISYTRFDLPKTLTQEGQTWAFAYDAFGNRVKKSGPDGTTFYLPGLFEQRRVGAQITDVFHVRAIAQVSYVEPSRPGSSGSTTVRYPLADQLGSTTLVTLADGTVDRSVRYYFEPFGRRINADGTVAAVPMGPVKTGFTGQTHDEEFGLIDFHGRLYDAVTRRFLTTDPVVARPGFSQSWNPYSYVDNSPLNLIDPTGFKEKDPFANSPVACVPGPNVCRDGAILADEIVVIAGRPGENFIHGMNERDAREAWYGDDPSGGTPCTRNMSCAYGPYIQDDPNGGAGGAPPTPPEPTWGQKMANRKAVYSAGAALCYGAKGNNVCVGSAIGISEAGELLSIEKEGTTIWGYSTAPWKDAGFSWDVGAGVDYGPVGEPDIPAHEMMTGGEYELCVETPAGSPCYSVGMPTGDGVEPPIPYRENRPSLLDIDSDKGFGVSYGAPLGAGSWGGSLSGWRKKAYPLTPYGEGAGGAGPQPWQPCSEGTC